MTLEELLDRIQGIESSDLEFKEAQHNVPKSAFETVAAFANTTGGWLIFGIRQVKAGFEVSGIVDAEKVQSDFITSLRGGRFSQFIDLRHSSYSIYDTIPALAHTSCPAADKKETGLPPDLC